MNDKSKAPNFLGLIDENNHIGLEDYKGSILIIYFYPKDKTSGCTLEKLQNCWGIKRFDQISFKLQRKRIT